MIFTETYPLSNGTNIPKLGFGTWFIEDNLAAEAVRQAVAAGYRHIDTAQAYDNERGVGEGIRTCGISREQIFVTSKVAAENKTYQSAADSIDETLQKMGLEYLDLMIIHSPQPWAEWRGEKRYFEENKETWKALEDAYKAGKLKAIGVSNFLQDDLESLLPSCEIRPMVNQILLHIGNTPLSLIEYCRSQNIQVESYSPIAHGQILKNPFVTEMAAKYGVTAPQLCVRYAIQMGTAALPKTGNPAHMKENAAIDFLIAEEDMEKLMHLSFEDTYGEFRVFPVFSGAPGQNKCSEEHGGFFGQGEPNNAYAQYFIGQSYLKPLTDPKETVFIANVTFEPGCRNNWHIHHAASGGGQILICVDGEGWYQEEGKTAQSLAPGDVVTIPAGVKHWHGAKKNSWFSHLAVECPGQECHNEWCEPVANEQYQNLQK